MPAESETSLPAILRTLTALGELDAHCRAQPKRKLKPAKSHLETAGRQVLMTRYGPLDLWGEIGSGHGYDDLLHDAVDFEIATGVRVHALGLRRLIEVKRETAGEKDLAVLPVLDRTLEESLRVRDAKVEVKPCGPPGSPRSGR